MKRDYHIPVLLKKSVDGLNIDPNGIYVDVTFGGGGHSIEILKKLTTGKLIAIDQDTDAEKNTKNIKSDKEYKNKFIFFHTNFKYLENFIQYAGYEKVDGIIADLGVSSHQFDEPTRGFSFMKSDIPDMRMNKDAKHSSLDILNYYSEDELFRILRTYGELKSAGKLSTAITKYRKETKINEIGQLNKIIRETIKTSKEYKIFAKVYQALRIETNKELEVLKDLLKQSSILLKKGGRLVIISYHSLEDRIVKNYLKFNNFEGIRITDFYGKQEKNFKEITKKAIIPDNIETETNSRARSAKLRIAERI